jgi:RimJ/RimL family protein N-acetyltransferase
MAIIIETERLILRPLAAGDLGTLAAALDNFNISKNTARIPFPYTLKDAEEFLVITQKTEPGTLRLAITAKDSGDHVRGSIGYEAGESVEIGYWLAEPDWGKGFGTEAARALTDHAFDVAGHGNLVAGFRHGNDASRRILEGLGFVKTGDAMMFSRAVGAEIPVTRLVLTRHNWRAAKGRRP